MSLENLKSIFKDGFTEQVEEYTSNKPIDVSDTKLTQQPRPILDSLLRGREYEKIRFSQNFENNNLFVKPETGEVQESLFRTQTFDPRVPFAKEGTLYFNTNKSFNEATNPTDFSTAIGNNDLPYTPLTELGGQFKENLSWENLYNSNHSLKDNPSYRGISPISYGANVNRDMLNMNYNVGGDGGQSVTQYGEKTGIVGGFSRRSISGNGEPYRVTNIGDRDNNRGSRFSPLRRALNDGDRILQFLVSAEGAAFILRQNSNALIENTVYRSGDELLRRQQRFGVTYNPLSTLAASALRVVGQGIPEVQFRRSFAKSDGLADAIRNFEQLTNNEAIAGFFEGESGYGPNSTDAKFSINDTFTKSNGGGGNGGGFFQQLQNAVTSLNPFDAGTTVPKTNTGDKMTLAPMIKGNTLGEVNATGEDGFSNVGDVLNFDVGDEKEGMPFYFKDLRDSTYIFFRAYIEGLTENISPSYSSHNYVGRSEPVYTYERAEREISFTLKLTAQTAEELKEIYKKMDRLTSMCYPQYVDEGETGYGNRMKPPLAKLRYGELFGKTDKELIGYIKSISYSIEQSSPYETEEGKRVPRHISATIGYQVIHDKTPSIDTTFYGINQEEITTTGNAAPGVGE